MPVMAVILLHPIEWYGDDDSDLRKGRRALRESSEFARLMQPVKCAAKPSLALVSSPTEKADLTDGKADTKIRKHSK